MPEFKKVVEHVRDIAKEISDNCDAADESNVVFDVETFLKNGWLKANRDNDEEKKIAFLVYGKIRRDDNDLSGSDIYSIHKLVVETINEFNEMILFYQKPIVRYINMIYPRVPLNKWLEKYPALIDEDDVSFCKCEEPDIQPFLTQKLIGIECQCCRTASWIYRKKEDNDRWVNSLLGITE